MNTPDEHRCPRCGAAVPATTAEGPCPACLLSGALEPTEGRTATLTTALAGSPAPVDPAELPCDLGAYRLLGLLGRGGMGTVYEAEHRPSGRRLALKMLGHQLDSPEMRRRFLREGRLAAGVSHPNSLYVFGSEEIGGAPVITMEIAGAGTLKDVLKRRGPLPPGEAVDAILDVVAGLEAAHAAGVLHRDVKPSNCFVGPDGAVKVGDFGLSVSTLAKDDTYVTASGVIMGTPAYASPEQLRGDDLDVRADLYSVGATLYTLLTGEAPFQGNNAVQVVAHVMNREPKPLGERRPDLPPGLARVVLRCLAKEPAGRYADYAALRDALLPFRSRAPEPASMAVRSSAGWIDYLVAFLPPYVAIMLTVGAEELFVRPLVERTLASAGTYFVLLGLGVLYFAITEGLWGAGLGKHLKGLRVVRPDGRPPGIARALVRVAIPIASVEGVRMPLMLAWIHDANWSGLRTAGFVLGFVVCGWIPALLALRARQDNGYATLWDRASGTRVVVLPKGIARASIAPEHAPGIADDGGPHLDPYRVVEEIVPGRWVVGADPVLRRRVWLLRRDASAPSAARRDVARPGRPRWLQAVETADGTWDAFEATAGTPLSRLVADGTRMAWSALRHWLHDLATELWKASGDGTLPATVGLDHVWITAQGRAVLLDDPWPAAAGLAPRIPIGDVTGQQRFLAAVAGGVDPTGVPVHARRVLRNLADGKFEKASFLAGTLQGLLERPAEVGPGIRAGSLFVVPTYVWIAVFVGHYHDKPWTDAPGRSVVLSALVVLAAIALALLVAVPFRSTASQAIFRLAIVGPDGAVASRRRLLARWAVAWLPLLVPVALVSAASMPPEGGALAFAAVALVAWLGAVVHAALHPSRGLHDRIAGTWVVRR